MIAVLGEPYIADTSYAQYRATKSGGERPVQFNFLWGLRGCAPARRGEDEIARWTVSPDTLAAFRKNDEEY